MAHRFNLADNRLPIFDQSPLPITDILSVLSFTDTDILEIADISVFYGYIGENYQNIADIWPKPITDSDNDISKSADISVIRYAIPVNYIKT